MMLLSHIAVAIINLIFATYVYFYPSQNKLKVIYFLTAFTFISGTILTIMKPSHLVQSCIMGLVYLGVVVFAIASARHKLASSK